MPIVNQIPRDLSEGARRIPVVVDRFTLQKRRWRAVASDGTDIAVDLDQPCRNGEVVAAIGGCDYITEQSAEPVLRIPLPQGPMEAARLGWFFGNQHLPVEIRDDALFLAYDEPLHARLKRLGVEAEVIESVFSPDPHSSHHHHH